MPHELTAPICRLRARLGIHGIELLGQLVLCQHADYRRPYLTESDFHAAREMAENLRDDLQEFIQAYDDLILDRHEAEKKSVAATAAATAAISAGVTAVATAAPRAVSIDVDRFSRELGTAAE